MQFKGPRGGRHAPRPQRAHGSTGDGSCTHCHHVGDTPRQTRASKRETTRRGLLVGGAGIAAGLAGCLGLGGDGGDKPEPVTLTQADSCEVCGMIIPNHPGPSVELFYADERPSGHENPARFCSTWEAFQYDFERQDRGWSREAFYVTDYSAVEYDLTTEGGDTLISRHVGADAFADATTVTFVVGSRVKGAMGRDLIPFGAERDAEAFQADYGGQLMQFADVTEGTIAQLANR